MSHLPLDPRADRNKRAWRPCPSCQTDCPHCGGNDDCATHWQYVLETNDKRISLQCPTCAHTWTADAVAGKPDQLDGPRSGDAVIATIALPGRPGDIATSPCGHVYVLVDDSVTVINRLHHIVATYPTGPHPKKLIVSADGTYVYVTGYDRSTSVINTVDNTVKSFELQRSTAESLHPDGTCIYTVHSGFVGGTDGSSVSVTNADGKTAAVVPVDRHAVGICVNPAGTKVYVSSKRSSSHLDWRGCILVIDAGSLKVVDKIAVEVAPDALWVSRDGTRLYTTSYHMNSVSIINLRTRDVSRWRFRDAPLELTVGPNDGFAYVTNLQSLTVVNTASHVTSTHFDGGLPRAVQVSADGKRVYLLDVGRRRLRALDAAGNSVVGDLAVEGYPEAMILAPDGEILYLTDCLDHTVKVIATSRLSRGAREE